MTPVRLGVGSDCLVSVSFDILAYFSDLMAFYVHSGYRQVLFGAMSSPFQVYDNAIPVHKFVLDVQLVSYFHFVNRFEEFSYQ